MISKLQFQTACAVLAILFVSCDSGSIKDGDTNGSVPPVSWERELLAGAVAAKIGDWYYEYGVLPAAGELKILEEFQASKINYIGKESELSWKYGSREKALLHNGDLIPVSIILDGTSYDFDVDLVDVSIAWKPYWITDVIYDSEYLHHSARNISNAIAYSCLRLYVDRDIIAASVDDIIMEPSGLAASDSKSYDELIWSCVNTEGSLRVEVQSSEWTRDYVFNMDGDEIINDTPQLIEISKGIDVPDDL